MWFNNLCAISFPMSSLPAIKAIPSTATYWNSESFDSVRCSMHYPKSSYTLRTLPVEAYASDVMVMLAYLAILWVTIPSTSKVASHRSDYPRNNSPRARAKNLEMEISKTLSGPVRIIVKNQFINTFRQSLNYCITNIFCAFTNKYKSQGECSHSR